MKVSSRACTVTVCAKCCAQDVAAVQLMLLRNALAVSSILLTLSPALTLPRLFQNRVLQMMPSLVPESREQCNASEIANLSFFLRHSPTLTLADPLSPTGPIAHIFYRKRDAILRREMVGVCLSYSP